MDLDCIREYPLIEADILLEQSGENGYLNKKFSKIKHPLKSYSLEYFPEQNVSKRQESANYKIIPNYDHFSLKQAIALHSRDLFDQNFPGFQRITLDYFPKDMKNIFSWKLSNEISIKSPSNNHIPSVTISWIRKFLESPLQSTAVYLLGMAENEEDVEEKIEEPLVLDRLSEWSLLRKIWDKSLQEVENEGDWASLYKLQTRPMMLEGKMPGGIFGLANQAKHIRVLNSWQNKLVSILGIDWGSLANNIFKFHFGGLREEFVYKSSPASYRFVRPPSLRFDYLAESKLDKSSIEIHGNTEWWYTDGSKNWKCIYLCERQNKEKNWLRHFLDILILREANLIPDDANVTGFCVSAEGKVESRKINLPSKRQSKEYLTNMIQEISNEENALLMPVESVLELSKENLSGSEYNSRFNEWMENKIHHSSGNIGVSSQYGPVKYLEDIPLPENPYQLMKSRFRLFFETISK